MAKKDKYIYIRVTNDKYEHIIALGDTAKELALLCDTNTSVIYSSISHNTGSYKKVLLEEVD